MTTEFLADSILATLLIAAIAAIWRLDARLGVLRAGQGAMAKTAQDLNASVMRAESAIKGLRLTADGCGEDLDLRIKRARAAADELALLCERASRTTPALAEARNASPAAPQPLLRALSGAR